MAGPAFVAKSVFLMRLGLPDLVVVDGCDHMRVTPRLPFLLQSKRKKSNRALPAYHRLAVKVDVRAANGQVRFAPERRPFVSAELSRTSAARPARVSSAGFHPACISLPGSATSVPPRRCHSSARPSACEARAISPGGTGSNPG